MRTAVLFLLALLAHAEEPWRIGWDGAVYQAAKPEALTRPIVFEQASGLGATFIARSLRGVTEDDWRKTQPVAGTRLDQLVHQPTRAFGSEQDRQRFGIAGQPGNWDNFAVQWDGCILIPAGGADLALKSEDGSRLWLDRDRDGQVGRYEWGGNNWGRSVAAAQSQVHTAVPPGAWTIRLQYDAGDGGNSCSLLWRTAGGAWTPVPAEAFPRTPVLTVLGPVTFRAPISGEGELRLGDGASLATAPAVGQLVISGRVTVAADLVLRQPIVYADAVLALAGHRLDCAAITGGGTVELDGGTLAITESCQVTVRGRGRLETRGECVLKSIDPQVELALTGPGSVRSPGRSLVRRALAAPLSTIIELGTVPEGAGTLLVDLDGPLAGAGLMAWRADRHGRWFQGLAEPRLRDGRQHLEIDLSAAAQLRPVGHDAAWNPLTADESRRAGLLLYADRPIAGTVLADARWLPPRSVSPAPALRLLALPRAEARTGERVELAVRPEPYPVRPLDPDCFDLALAVTAPDGSVTNYAGFADQPFRRLDRGDRERLLADGPPRFGVRVRPRQAGVHRLRLTARWAGGANAAVELPPVTAAGEAWDDIARVDARDRRFLSAQDRFVWPIGQNLNSTYDVRSRGCLATKLTPDRGSFTREAFLARLIAAGGTGGEAWLSPWNLGLEWTDAWAGFHGAGKPNLGNAWALDRYLDLAERHGVRLILSIYNHGQGRDGSGAEHDFRHHPWRTANGGWIDNPEQIFTDARALRAERDIFRYLAARWGDSPAVLAWKLWAEVDLTHASREVKSAWHVKAAELFARHDPWRHPVTTHWCGTWANAFPEIAQQPGMDMLTIDAYHGNGQLLAELLGQSTRDAGRGGGGLARYGKPVQVTEYGGTPSGCPQPQLAAELATAGWAALVHGHAGTPMLWWFEWIDQGSRYAAFGALRRFTAGEDLRDPSARTIAAPAGRLWCRAWQRPGRILGYVLDPAWAAQGTLDAEVAGAGLQLGEVAAGPLHLEWWDADLGVVLAASDLDHAGGPLLIQPPTFRRHLAFKLWRRDV